MLFKIILVGTIIFFSNFAFSSEVCVSALKSFASELEVNPIEKVLQTATHRYKNFASVGKHHKTLVKESRNNNPSLSWILGSDSFWKTLSRSLKNASTPYTKETLDWIRDAQTIISADGGAGHLRALNILPDVMIGDFDSILPEDQEFFEKKQVKKLTFSSRKDQTDTELCLSWALKNNATDITLLGVTGSRMDHTLANIFLLQKLARLNIPARIINKNNQIHIVMDFIELKGGPKDFLSIIPITNKVTGVTLKGLEYPLTNKTLKMGSCLGISNSFKETLASISIKKGCLIVIKSKD